mmetsp:Transcript_17940/g.23128  ORF Transcript_17940/g.23128 Transcript_17940/m.23128 type:complete len:426 (+) Transcript_17940:225-1502(+)
MSEQGNKPPSSVTDGIPPVRHLRESLSSEETRKPRNPNRPSLRTSVGGTRPSSSHAHRRVVSSSSPSRSSESDKDRVRSGCMTLPKSIMGAAEKAGLGSEERGMYGHIRGLATNETWTKYRKLVEAEILDAETLVKISFDDIVGLEDAKRLINEAAVLPLVIPEFFTGARQPWRGVLLFGPPGTGKTMLARAVAAMEGITFLNCSASLLINKYRGDSEKIARTIFEVAREKAPSIVFLDEVDAVLSSRGGGGASDGKDEGSRRLKTELLRQMDGIESAIDPDKSVVVMAASNFPWDLDEAFRRRLEKRIYIPLPEREERLDMIKRNMATVKSAETIDYEELATASENYSGADIRTFCREAAMRPLRRLLFELTPQEIQAKRRSGELDIPEVLDTDMKEALHRTRPSVSKDFCEKYVKWANEFRSI